MSKSESEQILRIIVREMSKESDDYRRNNLKVLADKIIANHFTVDYYDAIKTILIHSYRYNCG